MFSILAFAGKWFLGGKSWWSNIIAAAGIATAAAGGGYAFGYWHGYSSATNSAEVRNLKATAAALQREIDARDDAEDEAAAMADETAIIETSNNEVSDVLSAAIDRAPVVDGCATPDFLDGLRGLK